MSGTTKEWEVRSKRKKSRERLLRAHVSDLVFSPLRLAVRNLDPACLPTPVTSWCVYPNSHFCNNRMQFFVPSYSARASQQLSLRVLVALRSTVLPLAKEGKMACKSPSQAEKRLAPPSPPCSLITNRIARLGDFLFSRLVAWGQRGYPSFSGQVIG